jgi:hypothetical protein
MVAISHSKNLPFIDCVPFKQGSSASSKHFSLFFEYKFPIQGLAPEIYVSDRLLKAFNRGNIKSFELQRNV